MNINSATSSNAEAPRVVKNQMSELKVEDFINMMVTQLQNQDPLEPTKNDQILSQMSQIGQLQSAQQTQDALKTLVLQNNLGSAGNLIGKSIEGIDEFGDEVSGVVSSVKVEEGNVLLELDSGQKLELAKVLTITNPSGTAIAG